MQICHFLIWHSFQYTATSLTNVLPRILVWDQLKEQSSPSFKRASRQKPDQECLGIRGQEPKKLKKVVTQFLFLRSWPTKNFFTIALAPGSKNKHRLFSWRVREHTKWFVDEWLGETPSIAMAFTCTDWRWKNAYMVRQYERDYGTTACFVPRSFGWCGFERRSRLRPPMAQPLTHLLTHLDRICSSCWEASHLHETNLLTI